MDRTALHSDIYYFLLLVCVVSLPFAPYLSNWIMAMILVNWMLEGNYSAKLKIIANNRLAWLFISLFAAYLVGMLYASSVENGWDKLSQKFSILVFPMVILTSGPLRSGRFKFLAQSFVISCLTISLACIGFEVYKVVNIESFSSLNWDLITGPLYYEQNPGTSSIILDYFSYINLGSLIHIHPTHFSLYLAFCVLLICNYYLPRLEFAPKSETLLAMAAVLYCTIFIIFLSSRIAILAYLIVLVGFVFYWYKEKANPTKIGRAHV